MNMNEISFVFNGASLAEVDALSDRFGHECGKLFDAIRGVSGDDIRRDGKKANLPFALEIVEIIKFVRRG